MLCLGSGFICDELTKYALFSQNFDKFGSTLNSVFYAKFIDYCQINGKHFIVLTFVKKL